MDDFSHHFTGWDDAAAYAHDNMAVPTLTTVLDDLQLTEEAALRLGPRPQPAAMPATMSQPLAMASPASFAAFHPTIMPNAANNATGNADADATDADATDADTVVLTNASATGANASNARDVVVLDQMPPGLEPSEPKAKIRFNHWLSSSDGRYSSPQIEIRVGPIGSMQTFYVHRDVLTKSIWFRTALCGDFQEAQQQVVDLPEEDPDIFHFVVAFLYEGTYKPLRTAASALDPEKPKGKGKGKAKATAPEPAAPQANAARPNARRARDRGQPTAADAAAAQDPMLNSKLPTTHRVSCSCERCMSRREPSRCWNCGLRGPDRLSGLEGPVPFHIHAREIPPDINVAPGFPAAAAAGVQPLFGPNAGPQTNTNGTGNRAMTKSDRTHWFMAYELDINVYICADRFLMDDFRKAVARHAIDLLESAGLEAAYPKMLHLCNKLVCKVPSEDPLLKMVLARCGFLQSQLWDNAPEETQEFLVSHPEVATMILRETVIRHERQPTKGVDLPSMEVNDSARPPNTWTDMVTLRRGRDRWEAR